MKKQDIYLTRERYEEIRKKLEYLKTVRRRELSLEIGQAREHGDISENAEYDAAKNAQAFNEKRIIELEDQLGRVRIIDTKNIPKDEVFIGAVIKLKDLNSGEEFEYTLVSELEADISQNKISTASPVGKALLGHKKDEVVDIQIPAGILTYKIMNISR